MSPFAVALRELRFARGLRQAELASLVGCQRTYLSAVENDQYVAPPPDFVERLRSSLALTDDEARDLEAARVRSRRSYQVPDDAPQAVYELVFELFAKLDGLNAPMVEALTQMLKASNPARPPPSNVEGRIRRKDRRQAGKEAAV